MKVVYIGGPFRGPTHWVIAQNIRRAERLALKVWLLGAACICPHANTMHYQGEAPDDLWLQGDLAILQRCDALLLTADWIQSSGARAEAAFADEHGIPVFETIDDVEKWLKR